MTQQNQSTQNFNPNARELTPAERLENLEKEVKKTQERLQGRR